MILIASIALLLLLLLLLLLVVHGRDRHGATRLQQLEMLLLLFKQIGRVLSVLWVGVLVVVGAKLLIVLALEKERYKTLVFLLGVPPRAG